MPHTIDEVWDALQGIKVTLNKLNDLHPIKVKLDALMEPTKYFKIYSDCPKCHGDGTVLDVGEYGLDPNDVGATPPSIDPPSLRQCPLCKGAKRFDFGWQETNPSEYP